MKSLEDLISEAAKRGQLNHLSLIQTTKGFAAAYRTASANAHSMATHANPVEALRAALRDGEGATKRRRVTTAKPDDPHATDEMDFG